MTFDTSLVESLNSWGEKHVTLIKVCSNDLVYAVILLSVLWFVFTIFQLYPISNGFKEFVSRLLLKGIVIFIVPVGISVVVSEAISKVYVRQRPFVADSNVHLLVPHSADGGMPSHHLVFMAALITTIYFYQARLSLLLAVMALLTGFGRVAAGIHYPTDIIAGIAIGIAIAYLYRIVLLKFSQSRAML